LEHYGARRIVFLDVEANLGDFPAFLTTLELELLFLTRARAGT
jgi:hypothetical protein